LSQWQYADLFADGGYERLRTALHAKQAGRDAPPYIAPRRSYKKLALAAVMLTAAAILAYVLVWKRPRVDATAANVTEPPGMAHVRGGRFLMGLNGGPDPEATPAHEVTVESFYLDRLPVTAAEFHGPATQSEQGDRPVTNVTWDEAYAYCLAQGKRLPREAEWEFAARGTAGRLYPWGDEFDPSAVNSREAGVGHPEPVGARPRNRTPLGIADMSGNVWQWTADDYQPYPGRTPAFAIPPGAKVIRGGSFQSDRNNVSAVTRNLERPATRSSSIGFRCAR
jgi:formylglycine-generating enzyme required for sulfatase activity